MEFSTSQKGNQVLVYSGYEYLAFRNINGVITWRCRQHRSKKCSSLMKTKMREILKEPTEHSHDACPQRAKANAARSRMRREMAAAGANPSKVIQQVLSGLSDDVLVHMPKVSTLERTLRNHKKYYDLPHPLEVDCVIPEEYLPLIIYDSGEEDPDRIVVFGEEDHLDELNKDTLYGDGTFETVPRMFSQLYTWHTKELDSYPPCVCFLLRKKNSETYARMFTIMKSLVPDLAPRKLYLDLEKDCISAAKRSFPQTEVKGSHCHLFQNVLRKISSFGLKSEFEADENVRLKLKSLIALAFVPFYDVKNVFHALASTYPNEDRFNELLTYFYFRFVEGAAGREPRFPVEVWNHFGETVNGSFISTNYFEEYHKVLNSMAHGSGFSVGFIFEGLKRFIACCMLTQINAERDKMLVEKQCDLPDELIVISAQEYDREEDKLKYLQSLANLL